MVYDWQEFILYISTLYTYYELDLDISLILVYCAFCVHVNCEWDTAVDLGFLKGGFQCNITIVATEWHN